MWGQTNQTNYWNGSTDPREQRAKLREIARSYETEEAKHPFDMAVQRVAELQMLFIDLYGKGCDAAYVLPDDDAGRDNAFIMVCHLALCPVAPRWYRVNWLKAHTPWMSGAEQQKLLRRKVLTFKADTLALRLGVTYAMRQRLGFRTIGAYDVTKEMRKIRVAREQREKDRKRKEATRRANGAKPQAESAARTKPWEALGISKATYYRRKKRGETISSGVLGAKHCEVCPFEDVHFPDPPSERHEERWLSEEGACDGVCANKQRWSLR
jgi:hypothetical protein